MRRLYNLQNRFYEKILIMKPKSKNLKKYIKYYFLLI